MARRVREGLRCTTVALVAAALLGAALFAAGCASTGAFDAVVANPARTTEDRAEDARRKPVEFLRFTGVEEGMNVLDVSAGGGYTTELLALSVGPSGHVWAQVPKPSPRLSKRLKDHPMPNVTVAVRDFDDPIPDETPLFDLVTFILNYHDVAATPVDRERMDRFIYESIKPGGHLVVIDHAARAGRGTLDAGTLHRIDEQVVKSEFLHVGFKLEAESNFLRNPDDPRTAAFFNMNAPSDRFALRFVKE